MEHTKSFFLSVTQRIFSNWTALKLAVDHGMGSIEKAIEFCPYTTEVLYMNEGLTSDQIAAELEVYMDEQFNTELEDNSAAQVAEELLRFYQYCLEGNESTAKMEFEKLPPLQSWFICERSTCPLPVKQESSSDEDMDMDENEQENDGWTVVTNRRAK
ncbi:pre-rRNA-processing protein TSR2 homolog [Anoplolepis gracilipes]|uniref:pre-rRNA-processing protein TSR2 homolog n=1 Tax=Anoplolepis gracilipes TaxID=354296 RepID=UPI003B9FC153